MIALSLIAMSNSYAPNVNHSQKFEFLCNPQTGIFMDNIWEKWKLYDPITLLDKYKENIKLCKFLSIHTGSNDEYNMQWGSRAFQEKLKRMNITHFYKEHYGGHQGNENIFLNILSELSDFI
jgi:hypothetical protein